MLRKVLELMIQEVIGDPVIATRRMTWRGYVTHMGRRQLHTVFAGKKKIEHLEDLGVPESIILKSLKEIGWKVLGWISLTQHNDKRWTGIS
jgi:hypothetical protein